MSDVAPRVMTADEFLAWNDEQPEGDRYELVAGRVVAMVSERVAHARVKFRVARRLAEAAESNGLQCEVFTDGMAVRVDERTVYEPMRYFAAAPDWPTTSSSFATRSLWSKLFPQAQRRWTATPS